MPRYGFNFLWMFQWRPGQHPSPPDERALDFIAQQGFNFVRVPTDYRFWTTGFDYFHPNAAVFSHLDRYLAACQTRGLHLSLNLHRAPGYCIDRVNVELHNLWRSGVAQDAFVFIWTTFAQRYQGIPNTSLSFDLLNEPPAVGQYGMTREDHAALILRTVTAIRAIDPTREIVINGLSGGSQPLPEFADSVLSPGAPLGLIQSGRGYQPMSVSHYGADWWPASQRLPAPTYPLDWHGRHWNRDALVELYAPWRAIEAAGVKVHIGECGCYNQTPNDVAVRWLTDLFSLYQEYGWGFALWNFEGAFGIVEHGRPGARYEPMQGFKVDRTLLELMLASRVA